MPSQGIKRVAWCFTINNPKELPSELETRLQPYSKYYIFQHEQGSNGTDHWQGYIYLKRKHRLSWLKNHCDNTAHWECARGTPQENKTYCSKADSHVAGPWSFGQLPTITKGKRTDLVALRDNIRDGATRADIFTNHPSCFFKYQKGINAAKLLIKPTRDLDTFEPDIRLYCGPTGTGKTSSVYNDYPDCWEPMLGKDLWFDGYDSHETALFDDFSGQFRLTDLLKLLDRYIRKLPIKGASTWFAAIRCIITTNIHPSQWYKNTGRHESRRELYHALRRRFTVVREYVNPDQGGYDRDAVKDGYILYDNVNTIKEYFN